ncbi:hypothetical protein H0B56_02285 [Haloechinothrix sp. YIM 98757]|uniref:Xaa-Pro dipeptidyl-peptidase C-terminal domain-containing protein n=1 Tax=Haloechinothrix aidingensis TaxID=2752311 RepID=A0A838A696_9PSEU|nr:CocE/NonD family hydrolase [Haloechinothrix aidingensis]MBA0124365.1 hypothetical protein [Haloechinothrix aidingensis]
MRPRTALLVGAMCSVLVAAATPTAAETGAVTGEVTGDGPTVTHEVVDSFDGEPIFTTLFMPEGASTADPAPLVMRSHGWSGHGERDLAEASSTTRALLEAGYAVLTWDERGFGYSGGEVNVLKPRKEGRDASALIDWLATDPDVAARLACESGRGEDGTCADPVIGMTGGSYGGGIQLVTAAVDGEYSSTTDGGEPRVDALAPEITWNDLRYSLFGNRVLNFGWGELLYAVGVPTARGAGLDPRNPAGPRSGGLHPRIHQAQAEGAATNQMSGESVDFFGRSSIARYGAENPVAVPSLFMQGSVDTLFDLTEAARNFDHVRDRAPARLVAFCGGHVSCPDSYADADDRAFLDEAILDWFAKYLKGKDTDTGPPVAYRTNEGVWRSASDFTPDDARLVTAEGDGSVVSSPVPTTADPGSGPADAAITAQPSGPGDPHAFSVEVTSADDGSAELVGIPRARLEVSGEGQAMHLMLKLVDREAGEVVNLQETPVRVTDLAGEPQRFDIPMSGIAYTLPEGHHLDLQVSTTSVMHAPARTPATGEVSVEVDVPERRAGRVR